MTTTDDSSAQDSRQVDDLLARLVAKDGRIKLNMGMYCSSDGVTTVLKLEPESRHMLVKMPTGFGDRRPLLIDFRIDMSFVVDGVQARSSTIVERLEMFTGVLAMRLHYPERIDYPQQRQVPRVAVQPPVVVEARLTTAQGENVYCKLLDLSPLGFGAALDAAADFSAGEMLTLNMALPDPVEVRVELRHINLRDQARRGARIGGRFVTMTAGQRQCVERTVVSLQA